MPTTLPSNPDYLQVLYEIQTFYNNAWSTLVWIISIFLAIAGIGIPALIWFYQRRQRQIDIQAIMSAANEDIKTIEKLLTDTLQTQITASLKSFDERLANTHMELDKRIDRSIAIGLSLQGYTQSNAGLYTFAAISFTEATWGFYKADDYHNGQLSLEQLVICLKQIKKDQYQQLADQEITVDALLPFLTNKDKHGELTRSIAALRDADRQAKQRI